MKRMKILKLVQMKMFRRKERLLGERRRKKLKQRKNLK
jgi:hypothetical protein